jgi:transcriptional regulator with XRE-family HTH domain
VDATNELSQFLTSRRAKVTPEQAGLRAFGRRQVPGLRREEVASLAGVSVEYYKRLERGNAAGVSDSVLDALADALQLDDAERAHLFDVARAAGPVAPKRRRRASAQQVRPVVQRIVDTIGSPAAVSNMRSDYLYANALGRALYAPLFDSREQPPNAARFTFLDPAAQHFFTDWEKAAKDTVAALRSEAGRNPYDRALSDLVGELSTRSEPFRKCSWPSSVPSPAAARPRRSTCWRAGPPRPSTFRRRARPRTRSAGRAGTAASMRSDRPRGLTADCCSQAQMEQRTRRRVSPCSSGRSIRLCATGAGARPVPPSGPVREEGRAMPARRCAFSECRIRNRARAHTHETRPRPPRLPQHRTMANDGTYRREGRPRPAFRDISGRKGDTPD